MGDTDPPSSEIVLFERRRGVLVSTLNRPDRLNAWNDVAPGVVRTRLSEALWKDDEEGLVANTPLARLGDPEDVAAAVAFLGSDDAARITGETLTVDDGQSQVWASAATPTAAMAAQR